MERLERRMDQLIAAVTAENTVIDSAITLLNGLSAQIAATAGDPAKVTALAAEVTAKTKALSDAVAANTQPTA
jgi:hypothetical protein